MFDLLKTILDIIIVALLLFFPLLAMWYDVVRVHRQIAQNRLRDYIDDKRWERENMK